MKKIFLLNLVIIITFSSCTTYRYIYSASPPNNPYFTKKGESKFTGYYSTASSNNTSNGENAGGWDLQGAYAIGNHWALAAGYFNRREKDIYNNNSRYNSNTTIKYKRNLFDIGGGYFVPFDKAKQFTFNLYGGMAFGKFSFIEYQSDYDRFHNSSITKWYFQPSVNFMPTPNFRLSFVTKFSFVHYGNIQTSYTPDEIQSLSLNLIANKTIPFIEPAINIQFGLRKYPWVKLDYTISGTNHPFRYENIQLDSRTSNVSIGLSFDFSKMAKKK